MEGMSEGVKLYGINKLRETLVVAESTRRSMQSNRSKGTKPEIQLRLELWKQGLRGYRKNVRNLPGTPDLVFGRAKVAIFVHGCFWHGHDCGKARILRQNHEFWKEKVARNQSRHERDVSLLLELGYTVVTIWECEWKAEREGWIEKLKTLLESKRPKT